MSHRTTIDSRLSHPQDEISSVDPHVSVGEEFNRTLEGLLPWAVSVLVHLAIVLLAFFVVWSAAQAPVDDELVIARLNRPSDQQSLIDTQNVRTEQTVMLPTPTVQTQQAGAENDPLKSVTVEKVNFLPTIGVQGRPDLTLGKGAGPRDKGIFVSPPSQLGGNARTIVYCVDASGSMVDSFDYVINDLKAALRQLGPKQQFTVIFFQAGGAMEVPVPARGYKQATAANIRTVSDWISSEAGNVKPRGATDPVNAIKLAMGYQPQMMYLLSDNITGRGRYQVDAADLLSLIDRLQRSHTVKTRINTIQFLYPDALKTLDRIAEANGGSARFVDESLMR